MFNNDDDNNDFSFIHPILEFRFGPG